MGKKVSASKRGLDAHVALSPDHYIMSHDGESWTECGTPAELTAALNALAEEVEP